MRLDYARNLTRRPNQAKRPWTTLRLLMTVFALLAATLVLYPLVVFVLWWAGWIDIKRP